MEREKDISEKPADYYSTRVDDCGGGIFQLHEQSH